MKKIFLFMLAAFTISSCVKDVDPTSYEQTKDQVLTDNFNTTFGVTEAQYANHRWGMNTVSLIEIPMASSNTMRTASTNGNQWEGNGYEIPSDITDSELQAVLAVFNKKGAEKYESLIDLDCFFVQQVYKGESSYYNHSQYIDNDVSKGLKPNEQPNIIGSQHMDWLCTVTNKKVEVVSNYPYEEKIVIVDPYDDHINNFNNGNAGGNWTSDKTGKAIKAMMLMYASNTNKFGFKSSEDNGHVFYNFRMEEIGGNYYVGFDFEADGNNPNEKIDRDYIYNDWIVKIVPGHGVIPPLAQRVRVMAEDLGTMSSDFDYNDIVFDILFIKEGSSYKADIILQAAGGTLPLYIGEGEGNTYEVHALFGVDTDVMVNTHAEDRGLKGRSNLAPVHFTVNLPAGDYATMKAEDAVDALNITVKIGNNTVHLTPKASYGNYSNAPKMIVAPVGTEWVDERILISKVYNKFVDWISDPTVKWWEK